MNRHDIISSPEYWTQRIQLQLFDCIEKYMVEHHLNRTQLAQKLGVSKGYVSQLLNGDYDHRLSKLVDLALAMGCVPMLSLNPINEVYQQDKVRYDSNYTSFFPIKWENTLYSHSECNCDVFHTNMGENANLQNYYKIAS